MQETNIETLPAKTAAAEVAARTASEAVAEQRHTRAQRAGLVWVLQQVFSFPALLGAALLGAVFYIVRAFVVDPDVWWHIKVGESILATHSVPTTDPYSFTVFGAPWMAYEWLGEVVMAAVAKLGLRPLDLLLMAVAAAIVVGLYLLATLRSGNSKAAFVAVLLLFPITNASFTMRPQMFGYVFLILTLITLELFRRGNLWVLWFLPPIFLAWVNTHGSFIVGLGMIFVYWVCGLKRFSVGEIETRAWLPKERVRLELVFLACLAVLPITPYGTRLAVYPIDMAFSQPVNVASILEWQPMPLDQPGGKMFLAFLFGFLVLQMFFRFAWRLEEIVLYVGGTFMAALHVRFILLFVPFFAPVLATILARWVPPYERAKDKYILNAALVGALIAAMVHYFPSKAKFEERVAEHFPVHAVEYMRKNGIEGPIYNTYGFGGYLAWIGQKVFIDGRGDLYERGGVLPDYMHITKMKPGAMAVLNNYHVRACLLERDEPLAALLSASPKWKKVYFDKTSALFLNTDFMPTEQR